MGHYGLQRAAGLYFGQLSMIDEQSQDPFLIEERNQI